VTIHANPHPTIVGAVLLNSTDTRTSWYVGREEFLDFAAAIKRGNYDGLLRGEGVRDDVAVVHVPPSGHRDLGPDTAPVGEQVGERVRRHV